MSSEASSICRCLAFIANRCVERDPEELFYLELLVHEACMLVWPAYQTYFLHQQRLFFTGHRAAKIAAESLEDEVISSDEDNKDSDKEEEILPNPPTISSFSNGLQLYDYTKERKVDVKETTDVVNGTKIEAIFLTERRVLFSKNLQFSIPFSEAEVLHDPPKSIAPNEIRDVSFPTSEKLIRVEVKNLEDPGFYEIKSFSTRATLSWQVDTTKIFYIQKYDGKKAIDEKTYVWLTEDQIPKYPPFWSLWNGAFVGTWENWNKIQDKMAYANLITIAAKGGSPLIDEATREKAYSYQLCVEKKDWDLT